MKQMSFWRPLGTSPPRYPQSFLPATTSAALGDKKKAEPKPRLLHPTLICA